MVRTASTARAARIEHGDWQTPPDLAAAVVELVAAQRRFASVLEPTCGRGAFLAAARARLPAAQLLGFDVSEAYVEEARAALGDDATIEQADFFALDWARVLASLPEPLLVLGNPPWVTNAALGSLGSDNLPPKLNFKREQGLDARTGKSNFDISEWMLLELLAALAGHDFELAMLCKASVARRVAAQVDARGWPLAGELRSIDARRHFAAAVDAVLLRVWSVPEAAPLRWPSYASLDATEPAQHLGVVAGRVLRDLDAHHRTATLAGECELAWRSGIKHDCAAVMELSRDGAGLRRNGRGELVEIEDEHVLPLLKGSDLANRRLEPRRELIVTQRRIGEDTRALAEQAPRLWSYLDAHAADFAARKSSIYRGQPPFAMFGVGDYSFAPYKLAIGGLYKRLEFVLVRPLAGRPVLVDDTAYFLPCASEDEAEQLLALVTSPLAREFFESRVFWDHKRPINKALLGSLSLRALADALATRTTSEP